MATTLVLEGVEFPNLSVQRRAFPGAGIIPWFGSLASIPAGWLLCDGTNGTPDLRNVFVIGAGNLYAVGATGGQATVALSAPQLPSHSHTGSGATGANAAHDHTATVATDGNHNHTYSPTGVIGISGPNPFGPGPTQIRPATVGPGGSHTHPNIATASDGGHAHSISITLGNTGAGVAHENRPPYFAIPFIMMEP